MNRRGFTLIEALVALSLFTAGGTWLWWGLRRGLEIDQRLRWKQIAQEALVSEAERLHGRPQEWLRDTAYVLPAGGVRLRIRRVVLDSTRREKLMDPSLWDERMRQALRMRPREVLLEAWPDSSESKGTEEIPLSLTGDETQSPTEGKIRLFITVPDYLWF